MIFSLSPFAPENLVSRDGFDSPVPRQPAHLHTQAEFGAYLRDSSRVPQRRPFIYLKPPYSIGSVQSLWGHALAYRWRSLVLCLLCFRLHALVEAAALDSIVLRYDHTGAPIATRVSFFLFPLWFIWRCRFFRDFFFYHCRFLFVWRIRRTFFPSEWCFSTL